MSTRDLSRRHTPAAGSPPQPEAALAVVCALATTPVKGLRLCPRSEVELTRAGVADNRRFYLIDGRAHMVNGKQIGTLASVRADYDPHARRLTISLPDGTAAEATAEPGAAIETRFFSQTRKAHLVSGPWSELLATYTGTRLRLVEADAEQGGVDRGSSGAVTLVSRASVARLEAEAGGRPVDSRRFRMLVEVTGTEAHEEDEWVGRTLSIGAARAAIRGHVGRCLVTTRCPDTGVVDLPTLDLLGYRRDLPTTERLAFGVFGEVVGPGIVRVGDSVSLD